MYWLRGCVENMCIDREICKCCGMRASVERVGLKDVLS